MLFGVHMYKVSSSLLLRVVGSYRNAEDDEYRRYQNLLNFLTEGEAEGKESSPELKKIAADYEEEKKKLKKMEEERGERTRSVHEKGIAGLGKAFGRAFRDMLYDYMPGGYLRREEYVRKMSDDFYKMAYKRFNQELPKMISKKLKEKKVDINEGSIELDPETMNKIITDTIIYFSEHPEEIEKGLVNAYKSKDRGDKAAEGFFVPRIDEGTYNEMVRKSEGEVSEKVGDTDRGVLENLKDRDEVSWEWKGIDEHGILHFTLPELYGSREFTMKLPKDVQYIKPGTYTFNIKGVNPKRGAVVEFVEQSGIKSEDALEEIEESGLGIDQLRYFINNGILTRYNSYLRSQPVGKLVEEFIGEFNIGDHAIHSVQDIADLTKFGEIEDTTSKTRGEEKVKEKYEESKAERREKMDAMFNRWTSILAQYFLRIRERDGAEIAKAVSSKFPQEMATNTVAGIAATQPVIEMVLRYIMSPDMPLAGKGKADPWKHFVIDDFKKMAMEDPSVHKNFENLIRKKRKDVQPNLPVSDEEIKNLLKSVVDFPKIFTLLKDKIKKAIEESANDPALKTFFDRRRQFQAYIKNTLENETEAYMEAEHLNPEDAKDQKKIDRFMKDLVTRTVKQMTRQSSDERNLRMIRLLMPHLSILN